jgi:DNA-binding transcriptional ArsR family regulator
VVDDANGGAAAEPTLRPELELTRILHAMSDPHRLAMLKVLSDGRWHPCSAGDWATGLHKSTISHHVKVLREAGLLEDRQRNRAKHAMLRRAAVEARFPGLLDGVLANA